LATIGVCVFCAVTSVAALFVLYTEKEKTIMKKYRYAEFTDGFSFSQSQIKRGRFYINAEKPEIYIEEFSLTKDSAGYYTSLDKIGELGWELAFVTPCGIYSANKDKINILNNAYVFKKELEE
jgi:hypothetical protein